MKRLIIIISVIVLTVFAVLYAAAPSYTPSPAYEPSRFSVQVNSVTTDDTRLAADTTYWTNLGDFISIDKEWEEIRFAFYGYGDGTGIGDPTTGTFTCTIWAALEHSSAQLVYIGSGATSGGQLSHNPVTGVLLGVASTVADPNYLWAQVDVNGVYGTVWYEDIVDPNNFGYMGMIVVETHGYPYWYVQIDDMTDANVTSVTCIVGKHE